MILIPYQIEAEMLAAMCDAGVAPAGNECLVADGKLHRFRVEGDKRGTKNGWFVLFADENPVGVFGTWRTGEKHVWRANNWRSLSPSERAQQRTRIAEAKAQDEAERTKLRAMAATRAALLWAKTIPVADGHPYVARKRIEPMGARQQGSRLVLPVRRLSDGALMSLQFIDENGQKRLLKHGAKRGHAIPVHIPAQPSRVLICEGWATGCTLSTQSPGDLVLAAIDAGNLEPVALAARKRWPDLPLVVACDNDRKAPGRNPGMRAGRSAAIAAGGKVIWPEFPEGAPLTLSDFNDLVNYSRGGGV